MNFHLMLTLYLFLGFAALAAVAPATVGELSAAALTLLLWPVWIGGGFALWVMHKGEHRRG